MKKEKKQEKKKTRVWHFDGDTIAWGFVYDMNRSIDNNMSMDDRFKFVKNFVDRIYKMGTNKSYELDWREK